MGKGSGRRPTAVSEAEADARWAATFGLPAGKAALIDPSSPVGWIVADGVDTGAQGPQIADTRA